MTLKIVCVNAGNYLDRGNEYVRNLYNMVSRNLDKDFQFICFTDDPTPIEGVILHSLPLGLKGWWNKLALFKKGTFEDKDRIVYFDLDTVITGDLSEIANYKGPFAILRDFYRPNGLQSSVMLWEGSYGTHIWREFMSAGFPNIAGGDQAWIEQHVLRPDILQNLYPESFVSYKVHSSKYIPDKSKVVVFHGLPRPHECDGWVPAVWSGNYKTLDQVVGNTDEAQLIRNIEYSTKLPRKWFKELPAHEEHAVIVGGGPSLKHCIDEIRMRKQHGQKVFALNNSWHYLEKMGVFADGHIMLDARPQNADFVCPYAEQYYASQCDKAVWDKSPDAILWNHLNAGKILDDVPEAITFIAGGSTVGLNSLPLVYLLGYRNIHIYGFDSSYDDDRHHAYNQELNDKERVISVMAHGKEFTTAAWMAEQVNQFCLLVPQLLDLGCTLTIHGEGLLQHVARNMEAEPTVTAADLRAEAINERIKDIPNPVGVEVGVFTGELSRRLLKREDLTLSMVDSWKVHDTESDYAKTDFHGQLSAMEQEKYYQHTKLVTSFAGDRAKVIRKDSIEAANDFADKSLDFVFLDADHTYEGIKGDIKAWLPKVKPGGWISGHDYNNVDFPAWGVKKAVDELGEPDLGLNFTWFIQLDETA